MNMFQTRIRISPLASAALAMVFYGATAMAQPVVTSVLHAASYGKAIPQGSIFAIFGTNIGPPTLISAPALPLGTALGGTSIKFTPVSGGAAVDAFMVYTSAVQVSGILPSSAAPGNYNVTVSYNGQTSAGVAVTVVARAFGMFTLSSSGSGPAVLQNAVSSTELVVNQFTAPARPGQVMILYGTGLGAITVPDNNAPGAQDLLAAAGVKVIVGGRELTPLYAGRSPGLPGVDQINFTLPPDIATGCTVPLQVRAGGVTTVNPVSMSVAAEGAGICRHPLIPEESLRKLAAGQALTVGSFTLQAVQIFATVPILGELSLRSESFSGAVEKLTLANAAALDFDALGLTLTAGSCIVQKLRTNGFSLDSLDAPAVMSLDAGTPLTVNGPNVANRAVARGADGQYDTDFIELGLPTPGAPAAQPVIARGEYTVSGPGGADVAGFTARAQVPERPVWSNRADIASIRRTQPLTLNWTGGGADDVALVVGGGGARTGGTQEDPVYDATFFVCAQRASAGTFTVQPETLAQLPAVQADVITGTSIGLLGVLVQPGPDSGRFTLNLTGGGTADFAAFRYGFGTLKLLNIQ
ncbi:MAG: hypothetical protein R2762_11740 [Bryobacteraceae bacterium]